MTADLPDGLRARRPTTDDAPAVAALLNAYDMVELGEPDFEAALLLEDWQSPRMDLDRDTWLVFGADDRAALAYAEVLEEEPGKTLQAFARVHPEHWGRGVGTWLLAVAEDRARAYCAEKDLPSIDLHVVISGNDPAGHDLVAAHGYEPVRAFLHLQIALDSPPAVEAPAGITIEHPDPERDAELLHRLHEDTFAEHWGFSSEPLELFVSQNLAHESFDPGLWWIARDGDEPAAFLAARIWHERDIGWINDIGVMKSHRGRGIGEAMMRTAFGAFLARGYPHVRLNVDEGNSSAIRLYERVGMTPRRRWDMFRKEIVRS